MVLTNANQEQGLFVLANGLIRLVFYVNDLLIVARDQDALAKFKTAIKQRWSMSDLSIATQFCGVEMQRTGIGAINLSSS